MPVMAEGTGNPKRVHEVEERRSAVSRGFKFVKKEVSEGILPRIETELLAARKRAKQQMKEATTPLERSVYDGKS